MEGDAQRNTKIQKGKDKMKSRKARQNQYNKNEHGQSVLDIYFVGTKMDDVKAYDQKLQAMAIFNHDERVA